MRLRASPAVLAGAAVVVGGVAVIPRRLQRASEDAASSWPATAAMRYALPPERWHANKHTITSLRGISLGQCISSGRWFAGDAQCYAEFAQVAADVVAASQGADVLVPYPAPERVSDARILSSFVEVRRNLADEPFAPVMQSRDRRRVFRAVASRLVHATRAGSSSGRVFACSDALAVHPIAGSAVPSNRASDECRDQHGIWIGPDPRLTVLINQLDHIRIFISARGDRVDAAMADALRLAKSLGDTLPLAVDPKLGWLTCSARHVGTGVSVSMHVAVPRLVASAQHLAEVAADLAHLGVVLRHVPPTDPDSGVDGCIGVMFKPCGSVDEHGSIAVVREAVLLLLRAEDELAAR